MKHYDERIEKERSRGRVALKKWYFDVVLAGGGVLVVQLLELGGLGLRAGRLQVNLFEAKKPPFEGTIATETPRDDGSRLDFGSARFDQKALHFATTEVSGRLRYRPRWPSFTPHDPLLQSGGGSLRWSVPVPDADVELKLVFADGRELRTSGRGYHDSIRLEFWPWQSPLQELRWGHAFAGNHAAVWTTALTQGQKVEMVWKDGSLLTTGGPQLMLEQSRLLLERRSLDGDALKLGSLKSLVRSIGKDPHETKWLAQALIDGERGLGLHQAVRW